MTPEEAKQILDAHTLEEEGEEQDHALDEARALMRSDAALQKWFTRRQAEDRKIALAIAGVTPRAELKAKLLAVEARQKSTAKAVNRRTWLATLAAAIAAGWLAWARWGRPRSSDEEMSGWQKDSLTDIAQIDGGKLPLDRLTKDDAVIRSFLASAGSPLPKGLPTPLTDNPRIGCKSLQVAGHRAAVVCFEVAPGLAAHLVVIDVPPQQSGAQVGKPEFGSHGAWHYASWSDGEKTYLLGTRASMEKLKGLMS